MKARRKYDSDFKQAAVELARTSGKTTAELERDLGLSEGLLKYWVRAATKDGTAAFPGHGKLKPVDEELRQLRRENEVLRQEREILKKTIAIFSQAPKNGIGSS
jgi:transposase